MSSTSNSVEPRLDSLVCITVTYNPDLDALRRQRDRLPPASKWIVVDNASGEDVWNHLLTLDRGYSNDLFLRNQSNIGLASALNQGLSLARRSFPGVDYALLLDQDSEPDAGSVEKLLGTMEVLTACGQPIGCVGPRLMDRHTGLQHGFHQCTRWRWKRAYPASDSKDPVPCASLNGSGTLFPLWLVEQIGGLDEHFFIDHVDTEWSFRVQANGYALYGVPDALFEHGMGEQGRRFWFLGWKVWPERSPRRHYYLFRNAGFLLRRNYVPRVWKFWALLKLGLTVVVVLTLGPRRIEQMRQMGQGFMSGVTAKDAVPDHRC